jgi:hypothetical protein
MTPASGGTPITYQPEVFIAGEPRFYGAQATFRF